MIETPYLKRERGFLHIRAFFIQHGGLGRCKEKIVKGRRKKVKLGQIVLKATFFTYGFFLTYSNSKWLVQQINRIMEED